MIIKIIERENKKILSIIQHGEQTRYKVGKTFEMSGKKYEVISTNYNLGLNPNNTAEDSMTVFEIN